MQTTPRLPIKLYRTLIAAGDATQPVVLLLLRLYFGIGFAQAGWGKLANPQAAAADFASWGIPMPEFNVYAAGLTELVFGVMLAIGLLARLVSLPLIGVMIVAYLTAHRPEVFIQLTADFERVGVFDSGFRFGRMLSDFVAAAPFMHLVTCVIVLCFGPGKLSVDHALSRTVPDHCNPTAPKSEASPAT